MNRNILARALALALVVASPAAAQTVSWNHDPASAPGYGGFGDNNRPVRPLDGRVVLSK